MADDIALEIPADLLLPASGTGTLAVADGTTEILLSAADGLDGPTAAAFGWTGADRFTLYITNAAFPFFSTTFRPSLMRLHQDVPGAPDVG